MMLALLLACWSRAPGPAPLSLAQGPVHVIEQRVEGEAVDLVLLIRAGSAHDPVGQEGLAWLTAQSLVAAAQAREAPGQSPSLGRDLRWQVQPELVRFELRCAREESVLCAERLGSLVASPTFSGPAFELARARARIDLAEALGLGGSGPQREALALSLMDRWLYQGHPYGHAAQGRSGSLEVLGLADVQRFHADRYVRGAAALGIAGSPTVEAVVDVQAALGGLPGRMHRDATPRALPSDQGGELLIVEAPGASTVAVFGAALDRDTGIGERLALQAGLALLTSGAEGAPAGLRASLDAAEERLQPAFRLLVPLADGPDAATIAELRRLLGSLAEGEVDSDRLDAWKAAAQAELAARDADPKRSVRQAAAAHLLELPSPTDERQALEQLGVEQVSQALRRHLDAGNLKTLVLTSEGQRSSVVQAVEGEAAASDPLAPRAVHRVHATEILP
jgi:zinc protease